MAQNFRGFNFRAIGTAETSQADGSNFPSGYHLVMNLNFANRTTNTIKVQCYKKKPDTSATDEYFVVAGLTLPPEGSFFYDGKIVVDNTERLYFKSDTASSLDVIGSYIQEIST